MADLVTPPETGRPARFKSPEGYQGSEDTVQIKSNYKDLKRKREDDLAEIDRLKKELDAKNARVEELEARPVKKGRKNAPHKKAVVDAGGEPKPKRKRRTELELLLAVPPHVTDKRGVRKPPLSAAEKLARDAARIINSKSSEGKKPAKKTLKTTEVPIGETSHGGGTNDGGDDVGERPKTPSPDGGDVPGETPWAPKTPEKTPEKEPEDVDMGGVPPPAHMSQPEDAPLLGSVSSHKESLLSFTTPESALLLGSVSSNNSVPLPANQPKITPELSSRSSSISTITEGLATMPDPFKHDNTADIRSGTENEKEFSAWSSEYPEKPTVTVNPFSKPLDKVASAPINPFSKPTETTAVNPFSKQTPEPTEVPSVTQHEGFQKEDLPKDQTVQNYLSIHQVPTQHSSDSSGQWFSRPVGVRQIPISTGDTTKKHLPKDETIQKYTSKLVETLETAALKDDKVIPQDETVQKYISMQQEALEKTAPRDDIAPPKDQTVQNYVEENLPKDQSIQNYERVMGPATDKPVAGDKAGKAAAVPTKSPTTPVESKPPSAPFELTLPPLVPILAESFGGKPTGSKDVDEAEEKRLKEEKEAERDMYSENEEGDLNDDEMEELFGDEED